MARPIHLTQALFMVLLIAMSAAHVSAKNIISVDEYLPEFVFQAPYGQEEKKYLGLDEKEDFMLSELGPSYFLIEVVGAYCPVCHTQSAEVNQLFNRIKRDEMLREKILMFSIAPGATAMEIEYLKGTWNAPYPILGDYEYDFHKTIGSPDTPFTLIVSRDGKVLYAHLGRIPEPAVLMEKIRGIISLSLSNPD
ncbi:peroxiredoxin family protein [Desulfonatronovibrio hydrogenovorans]|uniref:peroxiredoxin family protein n=1 Tax=Desulfonatronovibrio hydrogenovorans TaxID=53245 RepID=UPI00048C8AAA|nr:hypothetical protein [Desulfonatronovibrio hydrogenovorans]